MPLLRDFLRPAGINLLNLLALCLPGFQVLNQLRLIVGIARNKFEPSPRIMDVFIKKTHHGRCQLRHIIPPSSNFLPLVLVVVIETRLLRLRFESLAPFGQPLFKSCDFLFKFTIGTM